ncbi:MAG: DUF423 domain-containing protein [Turneriella sp.]|nr:DUF423 domain-containing protein [Turneriella sp.]
MRLLVFAGVSGFFAVFFGAFGSHVLKASLSEKSFSVFQTANQYHFWHTLALLAVAFIRVSRPQKFYTASAAAFISGLALFSGSLYLYAVYQIKTFAMLAPLGGAAFMLGWLFFVLGTIREFSKKSAG